MNILQHEHLNKGNVKRQKVLTFANKRHEKRITSFAGFVAKLQQSLNNNDDQFIYYVTKKLLPFVTLLRENGIIHKFHIMSAEAQRQGLALYLSPDFDARLMVIYLKVVDKYAPALRQLKTFTVPSRRISISHMQLVEKTLAAGASTLYILNTPKGLLTHMAALHYQIGGEIVCEIR
jgi:ribosomal protein S8